MKKQNEDDPDDTVVAWVNYLIQEADYGKVLNKEARKVWLMMTDDGRQQFSDTVSQQLLNLKLERAVLQ